MSDDMDSEESLDFAQALNTALCFLCWINADVSVAEEFLTRWPEALLLEGSNNQDCATCIVKQRMRQCRCSGLFCNNNREGLLAVMNRGFQYYQNKHMNDLLGGSTGIGDEDNPPQQVELRSTSVFPKLMSTGRHIRNLSIEESAVHSQVVEAHVAKMMLERQLDEAKAVAKRKKSIVHGLLVCKSSHQKEREYKIVRLEHDVHVAELKLKSVEKEHRLLVNAIDRGHRNQYALLKGAFEGCARHECIRSRSTTHTDMAGD